MPESCVMADARNRAFYESQRRIWGKFWLEYYPLTRWNFGSRCFSVTNPTATTAFFIYASVGPLLSLR
jgi:hypothetical protein